MKRISPGLLLIAFFGLLAVLAGVYIWKKNPPAAPVQTKAPVRKQPTYIVASSDLPVGRVVHASDFMTVTVSAEQMKLNKWPAIMMADGRQIINRRLKVARKQGDPFPPDAFYPEDTEPDLTEQLPPGMRAISLTVRSEGLPAKATPGAIVDVILRTNPDDEANLPELTSLLVQRVQILAIGNNATAGTISKVDQKTKDHLVTLAVTTSQALKLKATEGHGEFSLTLRNLADDLSEPHPDELTLADIFNLPEPEAPPVPFVAEIFRRGQRQTLTFDPNTNGRLAQGADPTAPSAKPANGQRPRSKNAKPTRNQRIQDWPDSDPSNLNQDDANHDDSLNSDDPMQPDSAPAMRPREPGPITKLQPSTLSMRSNQPPSNKPTVSTNNRDLALAAPNVSKPNLETEDVAQSEAFQPTIGVSVIQPVADSEVPE